MQINVRELLAEDLGFSRSFEISGETPTAEQLDLVGSVDGEVTLTRLENAIAAKGVVTAPIQLECHRCLRPFTREARVKFERLFRFTPEDDDMPINHKQLSIDLMPLIEQELLVTQPIKQLCESDCPGICTDCGQRLDGTHKAHANED